MSYDIRFGVKVEGTQNVYAIIGRPEYDSPTYNIRDIFVNCMDWNYTQGEWYRMTEVLPKVEHGIHELTYNEDEYKKYNPSNGWGSTKSALECLQSIYDCFHPVNMWCLQYDEDIPLECIYMKF